jgi:hypothetical protein
MRGQRLRAATFLLLLACDGPLGPIPGGALAGPETPCPSDGFGFALAAREIQLEVRPDAPRSLTTWAVVDGDALHIPADFFNPGKRWPQQVDAEPRVRVRIEDRIYACAAHRVRDEPTIARLRAAAAAKYDVDPEGWASRQEVWWYRIGPRAPEADD